MLNDSFSLSLWLAQEAREKEQDHDFGSKNLVYLENAYIM